jgi:hypothetical protein
MNDYHYHILNITDVILGSMSNFGLLIKNQRAAKKLARLFEIRSDQGFPLKSSIIWENGNF